MSGSPRATVHRGPESYGDSHAEAEDTFAVRPSPSLRATMGLQGGVQIRVVRRQVSGGTCISKRLFAPQDKTLRRTRWFQNPEARSSLELGYVAVTSRVHYPLQYGARESASRWAFLARYT